MKSLAVACKIAKDHFSKNFSTNYLLFYVFSSMVNLKKQKNKYANCIEAKISNRKPQNK